MWNCQQNKDECLQNNYFACKALEDDWRCIQNCNEWRPICAHQNLDFCKNEPEECKDKLDLLLQDSSSGGNNSAQKKTTRRKVINTVVIVISVIIGFFIGSWLVKKVERIRSGYVFHQPAHDRIQQSLSALTTAETVHLLRKSKENLKDLREELNQKVSSFLGTPMEGIEKSEVDNIRLELAKEKELQRYYKARIQESEQSGDLQRVGDLDIDNLYRISEQNQMDISEMFASPK